MNNFLMGFLIAGGAAFLIWLFASEEEGILPGGRSILGFLIIICLVGIAVGYGAAKLL